MRTIFLLLVFAMAGGSQDLWRALKNNQMDEAKALLKNGYRIDQKNQDGYSALHLAAISDSTEAIKFLIKNGADIEDRSRDSETPVMVACSQSNLNAVKILVSSGAQLNTASDFPFSPLMTAIQSLKGSAAMLQYLLQHGADPLFEPYQTLDDMAFSNWTKSGLTATLNHTSDSTYFYLLYKVKPNPNLIFKNGQTLLMLAAFYNRLDVVKMLLAAHADIARVDPQGNTALMYAAKGTADSTLLEFLIEHGADCQQGNHLQETPLMMASKLNQLANIRTLLRHKVDINAVSSQQKTALLYALADKQIASAKLLLDSGATPVVFASDGLNSIYLGLGLRDQKLAFKIISAGKLDLNRKLWLDNSSLNSVFLRVLPWAIAQGWGEVIDLALARGVDPKLMDYQHLPPLPLAYQSNQPAAFQILVSKGVPIEKAMRNQYLLWLAQSPDSLNTIATLIRDGASVNCQNQTGDTPLILAAKANQPGNVRELLRLHADPSLRNSESISALVYAIGQRAEDCIQALKLRSGTVP